MGNVQILKQSQNSSALTDFQKNKLIFDFQTFFDLNNDGYLSYKVIYYEMRCDNKYQHNLVLVLVLVLVNI